VLHVYADLVAAFRSAATPAWPLTWRPAGRALRTWRASCWRWPVASPAAGSAGAVTSREVLAFDLYGTLVDPIAISAELGRLLGEPSGLEAARLWRSKQLEYSFRLTTMGQYEDF